MNPGCNYTWAEMIGVGESEGEGGERVEVSDGVSNVVCVDERHHRLKEGLIGHLVQGHASAWTRMLGMRVDLVPTFAGDGAVTFADDTKDGGDVVHVHGDQ